MKIDRVVYVIRNRVNGKQYVGISNYGTANRWRGHVSEAQTGTPYPLHRAIRKYGAACFTIHVLERCASDSKLKAAEVRWINKLDAYHNGYNATFGGDGVHGLKFSPASQRKLMARLVATHTSLDYKRKMQTVARAAQLLPEYKRKWAAGWRAARAAQLVLPEKLIIKLYQQGWTLSAIGQKVGTGQRPNIKAPRTGRIRRLLIRAGVYRKPKSKGKP
ncbi:MAG: GIY-YIG nuclease family protein [Terriglobales bacterium]